MRISDWSSDVCSSDLLAAIPGLTVAEAGSATQAVRGADIVTTVTADKTYATILTPDMIEPGMHLNAVGGDCPGKTELHRAILATASRSEERRVGKGCVLTGRSRWSP